MSRIHIGMIVYTNYNTGPYRIVDMKEGCTCASFLDYINLLDKAPLSRPHYHLTCRKIGEKTGFYYLNGYDDNLCSVWDNDYLIDCEDLLPILTLLL